ncbi:MAG: serpin family protein [Clostridia bacterium]|nr:serpin family protein [Clostridia bacterium]
MNSKNNIWRRLLSLALSVALVLSLAVNLSGCALKIHAADLMEGIEARDLGEPAEPQEDRAAKTADFAVRLFRESIVPGENTLVSPLSVFAALAMTANGAKGETKAQMEAVLGMTAEELNEFFRSYAAALSDTKKCKLRLANSIWFTDKNGFSADRDFLQTNADYYGADAYKAPFNDTTLKDINNWVKDKTDGMIPDILDRIPPNALMYLVNALSFEAEWEVVYSKNKVGSGKFTREDGTVKNAEFMYSTENQYIEDDLATGFIKYYAGGQYAFAALLPNEGVSVADYIATLDGATLRNLLGSAQRTSVEAALPKFETEFKTELSEVLRSMGMPLAFDADSADFSGLGTANDNIYIGRVLHKTFISVSEQGTRAGAAAAVEMIFKGMKPETTKQVYLDRPFVYMLIDTRTNVPFIIGTAMDI